MTCVGQSRHKPALSGHLSKHRLRPWSYSYTRLASELNCHVFTSQLGQLAKDHHSWTGWLLMLSPRRYGVLKKEGWGRPGVSSNSSQQVVCSCACGLSEGLEYIGGKGLGDRAPYT
ncbi:mCG1035201 [Mus musculus]|uniref:Uncharacterized protein n=1 Tax=Mus musculus TaxID=10090 RepID=Q9D569_MOUSE|nr:mCG1035201 [Mus musculus]BAB29951.1 unnamed protein product [Mus musculus]